MTCSLPGEIFTEGQLARKLLAYRLLIYIIYWPAVTVTGVGCSLLLTFHGMSY
jgi:hypothetical protein